MFLYQKPTHTCQYLHICIHDSQMYTHLYGVTEQHIKGNVWFWIYRYLSEHTNIHTHTHTRNVTIKYYVNVIEDVFTSPHCHPPGRLGILCNVIFAWRMQKKHPLRELRGFVFFLVGNFYINCYQHSMLQAVVAYKLL